MTPQSSSRALGLFLLVHDEMEIRDMQPEDWPAVKAVYEEGIATKMATFELAAPGWKEWDDDHLPSARIVAEVDGAVVGWAALSPTSRRACYSGVVEESVYVAESARGRGVGQALLGELLARTDAAGVWTVQASIFPENRASVALHERCGFRVVGTRERIARMDGVWRDTVLMERRRP